MNEVEPSGWTHARLERLGRTLGARDGTGPDDDPLLRSLRGESRKEGREEGRKESLAEAVREIVRLRGVEVSEGFPGVLPDLPRQTVVAAALACDSERDFHARLRKP